MLSVTFCSFCQSQIMTGMLTVEDSDGLILELPCCDECVDKIDENGNITVDFLEKMGPQ